MANGRESEKYVAEIRRLLPSDIGMLPLRNIVTSATYLLHSAGNPTEREPGTWSGSGLRNIGTGAR